MKGFFVAAALCALPLAGQAADSDRLHGSVRFTGEVVNGLCTVTSHRQGRLYESCEQDAAAASLTVQAAASTSASRISVRPLPQTSARRDHQYQLINATGSPVQQGRYVITQTAL